MRYLTKTLDFDSRGDSVVTLGKFDGLHRGHQKLIRRTRECARQGLCAGIFGPFSGPGVGELFHSRVE